MADTFPYKTKFANWDLVRTRFENLKSKTPLLTNEEYHIFNLNNFSPSEISYTGEFTDGKTGQVYDSNVLKYCLLNCDKSDYWKYDYISPFFVDHLIVKCKRVDQKYTPMEWYKNNKKNLEEMPEWLQRETIFKSCKEVGVFRPSVMVSMIRHFFSDPSIIRVLDFSSGWGDRFIGAMACNVEYYLGVDPRRELESVYEKMADFFSFEKSKYKFYYKPFEDIKVNDKKKFNLVFTSPPYFDLEHYSDEKTQSDIRYKTVREWYESFLLTSVQNSIECLEQDGYLVLVLNRQKNIDFDYVGNLIDDINRRQDVSYLGTISYADICNDNIYSPQPMWIWTKVSADTDSVENLEIISCDENNKRFDVAQDGYLAGGTKERAIPFLIQPSDYCNELVMTGSAFNIDAPALGILGKKKGIYTSIYVTEDYDLLFKKASFASRARALGVRLVCCGSSPKEAYNRAKTYVSKQQKRHIFTFDRNAIEKSLAPFKEQLQKYKNIWIATDCKDLVEALLNISNPKCKIQVVKLGGQRFVQDERLIIHLPGIKYTYEATVKPPYSSCPQTDAKVWSFFLDHGQNGDLIWNTSFINDDS